MEKNEEKNDKEVIENFALLTSPAEFIGEFAGDTISNIIDRNLKEFYAEENKGEYLSNFIMGLFSLICLALLIRYGYYFIRTFFKKRSLKKLGITFP